MNPMKSMREDHQYFSAPLGTSTSGRLELTGGATSTNLTLLPLESPSRVEALFEGPAPEVQVVNGDVLVNYRRRFWPVDRRRVAAEVALHPAVTWTVAFRGGVSRLNADLARLSTTNIDIDGGVSDLRLLLPTPTGTLRVCVNGGVSEALVLCPAGVPFRVSVRGGATNLHVDRLVLGAIGAPFEWESPDYATSADRIEIEIVGGVSGLTVCTANEARPRTEPDNALVAP